VRNSGALAVIEGVGHHACEYMTGGQVFVLGMTGNNFGAGMTGGSAYVFDTDGSFSKRYNPDTIRIHRVVEESDVEHIQSHVYRHLELTDSQRAREILNGWVDFRYLFWKIVPKTAVPAKT
jgi:glutamate synthase domain-containing protein 3